MLNGSISFFYAEVLDGFRLAAFKKLKKYKRYGYLAGGTALALQVGHRISYDFDIFCKKKITNDLINNCRKDFVIKQVLVNSEDEFTFLTEENIKITFLYYPFIFQSKLVNSKIGPPLLNILNIATAKAYALNRRGTWRDYIDLYFIIKNGLASLEEIIKNGQRVYAELFSPKLFLGQLVYTADLSKEDVESVNLLLGKITISEIKRFFVSEVKRRLRSKKINA